jgi:hypothetical protein
MGRNRRFDHRQLPHNPPRQFSYFGVNGVYNEAFWPIDLLVIGVLLTLLRPTPSSNQLACATVAFMWMWTGIAYYFVFFASINKMAYGFDALFVFQGALIAYDGVFQNAVGLGAAPTASKIGGAVFVIYAVAVYPLIGLTRGNAIVELPMFGVTPCPVTIFTLGLLLPAQNPPKRLFAIPALCSLIGGSAAFLLNVPQDYALLVSGGLAIGLRVAADQAMHRAGDRQMALGSR